MQLTICAWDERVFSIEVDADESVENVKAILEAESGVSSPQQSLLFNGRPLVDDSAKLTSVGVGAGDVLMLFKVLPAQQSAPAGRPIAGGGSGGIYFANMQHPSLQLAADGSALAPAALVQTLKADGARMGQLSAHFAPLAQAIRSDDLQRVQELLRQMYKAQVEHQQELQRMEELADADPFDLDAQRRIEELIHKKNIDENYLAAMESSPEALSEAFLFHENLAAMDSSPEVFAQVSMLYVDMIVNGVAVKAFVDSGAQMTIMTEEFARKCHLERLMDRRYQGMAVGVGASKITGRIHQAPLLVSGHHTTTSITVLEQKSGPNFIFGLDMLRRHQCTINLRIGALEFGSCDAVLPFLGDSDIPRDPKQHIEETSEQDADARMRSGSDATGISGAAGPVTGGTPPAVAPTVAAGNAAAARAAAVPSNSAAQPTSSSSEPPLASSEARPTASADAAAAGGGVEGAVSQLQALGFPQDQCLEALRLANGDVDAAGAILFGGF